MRPTPFVTSDEAKAARNAQAQKRLLERGWPITILLFISGFINYLDRAIISVALPVIAMDLHLGPARMGILLSAFFWSYALMQIPIGWLCDRFNIRRLYAAAFALWSLTSGFTGFAGSLTVLIVFRVLLGVGESIYLPGGMKMVSLLFHAKDRGLASGLVNCGTRAGLALGAPLIAFMVAHLGWHRSFIFLGFIALLWLVPWFITFPAGASTVSYRTDDPKKPNGRWKLARTDRNLLALSLGHVGYGYYFYLLVTWLPTYLVQARHLTLQTAGVYAFAPYIVFTLSEPIGGWMADRLVVLGWDELFSRRVIITVAYMSSILLIVAGRAASNSSALVMLTLASLVGLSTGNIFALVQSLAPDGEVGFATGFLNLAGNLSGIVAPLATGLLIAQTGSYFVAFVTAVIVLIAALPTYWLTVRKNGTVLTLTS